MEHLIPILCIGIGATLVMDLWGILRKPLLGIKAPDYGMVGRWIAHMRHGQLHHTAIAKSPAIRGELALGWFIHYLTGCAFAVFLIAVSGAGWLQQPTVFPAIVVGLVTVTAPFLLMQPGMGAGIAASKTPNPNSARLQSIITHAVFGLGLYVSGLTTKWVLEL